MNNTPPTIHLEAYDWEFQKPTVFVLGTIEESLRIFIHIQTDLLFRGRRILVLVGNETLKAGSRMTIFQQNWDFVIQIRGNIDYSILASYIQNSVKPASILWLGSEIPSVLLHKYDSQVHWICWTGTLPASKEFSTYFISPSLQVFKYKDWFLLQQPHDAQAILANLEDLRERGAGIVFQQKEKVVKWYDSTGLQTNDDKTTVQDIKEIMKWCVNQLENIDT